MRKLTLLTWILYDTFRLLREAYNEDDKEEISHILNSAESVFWCNLPKRLREIIKRGRKEK